MAKKSVIDKLLALSDELDEAIVHEKNSRTSKALLVIKGGLSHLQSSLDQNASLSKPLVSSARNAGRKS